MKRYIEHIIRSEEKRVEEFLVTQDKDPQSYTYGLMKRDIVEAKPTIYVMATALALFFHPQSKYYKDQNLYEALNLAIDGTARVQRESGYIDYPSCNFYSAPDTSFCFKRLFAAYRLMRKYDAAADTSLLQAKYLAVLKKAAAAIRDGGFHTPNHRWGVCAALMQAANLFKDDKEFSDSLMKRTELYLQEGIDGNSEGEYAERSTGNYNAVVNNAMIAMFQESKDVSFLGYVQRNLRMMMYYIEPDDSIFTKNSTRQDRGKAIFMDPYLYQYMYMLVYDGKEGCHKLTEKEHRVFDAAAHKIIRDNCERGELAPNCFHIMMLHDSMLSYEFSGYGFLDTYRKLFSEAGVLRVKKENYAYTVNKGNTTFLYFNVKGLEASLKIGESYCEIRNFIPQVMDVNEGETVLKATARGWYYLPWKEKPETSDWWKMDHSKRDLMITSDLNITVTIKELDDGLEVTTETEGLEGLPLRMELCVPAEAVMQNPHFYMITAPGQEFILRDDYVALTSGLNTIKFGPGFGEHEFKGHYSGEEINSTGCTIYCNAYTPVKRTFTLKTC